MSTPIVAPAPTSGHTPTSAPLGAVTLGWLGVSIDKLAELRAEKHRLDEAERTLTREITATMVRHGLPALRAEHAVATVVPRTDRVADPRALVGLVGLDRATPALRVLIDKARDLVSGEDLDRISTATTTTTLRIDPIR